MSCAQKARSELHSEGWAQSSVEKLWLGSHGLDTKEKMDCEFWLWSLNPSVWSVGNISVAAEVACKEFVLELS